MTYLDYYLLLPGDSLVASEELDMQHMNRVGGYWLRNYPIAQGVAASMEDVLL